MTIKKKWEEEDDEKLREKSYKLEQKPTLEKKGKTEICINPNLQLINVTQVKLKFFYTKLD